MFDFTRSSLIETTRNPHKHSATSSIMASKKILASLKAKITRKQKSPVTKVCKNPKDDLLLETSELLIHHCKTNCFDRLNPRDHSFLHSLISGWEQAYFALRMEGDARLEVDIPMTAALDRCFLIFDETLFEGLVRKSHKLTYFKPRDQVASDLPESDWRKQSVTTATEIFLNLNFSPNDESYVSIHRRPIVYIGLLLRHMIQAYLQLHVCGCSPACLANDKDIQRLGLTSNGAMFCDVAYAVQHRIQAELDILTFLGIDRAVDEERAARREQAAQAAPRASDGAEPWELFSTAPSDQVFSRAQLESWGLRP
jgi:hypothetical protein